jgi:hypothetical protein
MIKRRTGYMTSFVPFTTRDAGQQEFSFWSPLKRLSGTLLVQFSGRTIGRGWLTKND